MGERPGVSCSRDHIGEGGKDSRVGVEPGFRGSGKGKWRTGPRKERVRWRGKRADRGRKGSAVTEEGGQLWD